MIFLSMAIASFLPVKIPSTNRKINPARVVTVMLPIALETVKRLQVVMVATAIILFIPARAAVLLTVRQVQLQEIPVVRMRMEMETVQGVIV